MLILFAKKNASKTSTKNPIEKAREKSISATFYFLLQNHDEKDSDANSLNSRDTLYSRLRIRRITTMNNFIL